MATDEPATNGVAWRLRAIEQRLARLEEHEPAVIAERVEQLTRELAAIRAEAVALRRSLYAFALSVTGSAIAFGVGVMALVR